MAVPDFGIPTRQVGVKDGKRVFAAACGHTLCDDATFAGRLVGHTSGRPLYGVVDEGCEYPFPFTPGWEYQAEWPPFGISDLLTARVTDAQICTDWMCQEFNAEFDGTYWTWTIGGIVLRMHLELLGGVWSLVFDLTECIAPCTATFHSEPNVLCTWPLKVQIILSPESSTCCSCCPDTTATMTLEIRGYCARVHQARQVAVKDGKRVFAYADCTPQPTCPELTCCPNNECSLEACFGVGFCGCVSCVTLVPVGDFSTRTWDSGPFDGSCNGVEWDFRIQCVGTVGNVTTFDWTLACDTNCSGSGSVDVVDACSDNKLDFTFTIDWPCTAPPPLPNQPCCSEGTHTFTVRVTRASCGYFGAAGGPPPLVEVVA